MKRVRNYPVPKTIGFGKSKSKSAKPAIQHPLPLATSHKKGATLIKPLIDPDFNRIIHSQPGFNTSCLHESLRDRTAYRAAQ
jgi:hypothetical protein